MWYGNLPTSCLHVIVSRYLEDTLPCCQDATPTAWPSLQKSSSGRPSSPQLNSLRQENPWQGSSRTRLQANSALWGGRGWGLCMHTPQHTSSRDRQTSLTTRSTHHRLTPQTYIRHRLTNSTHTPGKHGHHDSFTNTTLHTAHSHPSRHTCTLNMHQIHTQALHADTYKVTAYDSHTAHPGRAFVCSPVHTLP